MVRIRKRFPKVIMITNDEAIDLTQYLRSILSGKMRGAVPNRCRRAASAATAMGRDEDDDLIQDTLARIVESLDDRLPQLELRAYAKATLHNVAVDKARKGSRARHHIARYTETICGLTAPSGEHEIELANLLVAQLTASEKQVIDRLLHGESVHPASKRDLRDKLGTLGAIAAKQSPESRRRQELAQIAKSLALIPELYRNVAELFLAGKTPAEIAASLDLTSDTVHKYIFRAKLVAKGKAIQ